VIPPTSFALSESPVTLTSPGEIFCDRSVICFEP
jgi:hypothetical protein